MKKFVKWFLIGTMSVVVLGTVGVYLYWSSSSPDYSENIRFNSVQYTVDVYTDDQGIPHIYATNKKDLYFALGFITAQERMLQIELMRRVSKGQLSEVFGEQALPIDKLFLTIGIDELAQRNAKDYINRNPDGIEEVTAYVDGVNELIFNHRLPFEMTFAGLQPDTFKIEDIFAIAAYMAYGFALAPKTDPLASELANSMGKDWVNNLWLKADSSWYSSPIHTAQKLDSSYADILNLLPVAIFHGSNSWALSGANTESGKAILCNDTHIGYGIPQVWFEAHINCPKFEFYGNFLPGIPYALVGHNNALGWGLTMFENDDLDFYIESFSADSSTFKFDSSTYPVERVGKIIHVKDQEDVTLQVLKSKHGPLVNKVMSEMLTSQPVSMRWDYTLGENRLLEAFRQMNNATGIEQFRQALPMIHGPGLNVVYADTSDQIGWWACARLLEWNPHVNTKMMLRGDRPEDEPIRSLPFEQNPHLINPSNGIIVSANEQHGAANGKIYPGYYVPPSRAKRIHSLLSQHDNWDSEGMKLILLDNICDEDAVNAQLLYTLITQNDTALNEHERSALELLEKWNGSYATKSQGALIFQRLNYQLLKAAFADEMSSGQFEQFMHLHWMKRAAQKLLSEEIHPAWDNINTTEIETRSTWVLTAFQNAAHDLQSVYGDDPSGWTWGEAHQLTIKHPLATNSLTGKLLNLGPLQAPGGNETINQSGFIPSEYPSYPPYFGPQMRIIIDFAQVENSESITPCGQSGHRWSPYYKNQFENYVKGTFRKQLMNWKSISLFPHRKFVPFE